MRSFCRKLHVWQNFSSGVDGKDRKVGYFQRLISPERKELSKIWLCSWDSLMSGYHNAISYYVHILLQLLLHIVHLVHDDQFEGVEYVGETSLSIGERLIKKLQEKSTYPKSVPHNWFSFSHKSSLSYLIDCIILHTKIITFSMKVNVILTMLTHSTLFSSNKNWVFLPILLDTKKIHNEFMKTYHTVLKQQ